MKRHTNVDHLAPPNIPKFMGFWDNDWDSGHGSTARLVAIRTCPRMLWDDGNHGNSWDPRLYQTRMYRARQVQRVMKHVLPALLSFLDSRNFGDLPKPPNSSFCQHWSHPSTQKIKSKTKSLVRDWTNSGILHHLTSSYQWKQRGNNGHEDPNLSYTFPMKAMDEDFWTHGVDP